jgi:hypothetical protein
MDCVVVLGVKWLWDWDYFVVVGLDSLGVQFEKQCGGSQR